MNELKASVIITTKNRKEDVCRAIESCLAQTIVPEVIVIDDGSDDGTSDIVRAKFPTVRLIRSETSQGVAAQRNRGAQLASGDIVFSIDDDIVLVSPQTVEQTLRDFDSPSVGLVAIPFINVKIDDRIHYLAPDATGKFATAPFGGGACAVRRDIFLRVGGYRESLMQEMEEEDFCIRLLDAGYFTCIGRASPLHHFCSPARDSEWRSRRSGRNRVLFTWYNVPQPIFLVHLPATCLIRILHGFKAHDAAAIVRGIAQGIGYCARHLSDRKPVRRRTYRLYRRLRKLSGLPLEVGRKYLQSDAA
ncbi:MAG TPA: glycosyltransferase [Stellaceae bacterium]|jgi:GT2 family glycosyltransferase|nr:glycosyltransferase [Stellaceae bacterium]